jgi:hypothetical protein
MTQPQWQQPPYPQQPGQTPASSPAGPALGPAAAGALGKPATSSVFADLAMQRQAVIQHLYGQQSFALALIAGLVAMAVGAGLWALITIVTDFLIAFMAMGVGFLVGAAIRKAGKAVTPPFGVLGAVLSLAGCVLGNLLSYAGWLAKHHGLSFSDAVAFVFSNVGLCLKEFFHPLDVLFYALALYMGFRVSYTKIDEAALTTSLAMHGSPAVQPPVSTPPGVQPPPGGPPPGGYPPIGGPPRQT